MVLSVFLCAFRVTEQSGFVGALVSPRPAVADCVLGDDRDEETFWTV